MNELNQFLYGDNSNWRNFGLASLLTDEQYQQILDYCGDDE